MSKEPYTDEFKLGISTLFFTSIILIGAGIMTGKPWVIAGSLFIGIFIIWPCILAVKSPRWDGEDDESSL